MSVVRVPTGIQWGVDAVRDRSTAGGGGCGASGGGNVIVFLDSVAVIVVVVIVAVSIVVVITIVVAILGLLPFNIFPLAILTAVADNELYL